MLAALSITELTTAITDGITSAQSLIVAGFAATALFVTARLIKKGANRIG